MNQIDKNESNSWILWIFSLQIIVNVFILLDVPIVRQFIGFIYLTLVPGYIIIKMLKLNVFDKLETVLFSIGLSIAFLMFIGLLVNEFGLLLTIPQPLSLISLMISLKYSLLIP